jgi:hypothetical protein
LGSGATNTLSASVAPTITGSPVSFTALAATQIAITQQPPANSASGANFTVTVQLRTAGNVLSPFNNHPVTISIASGGGTLNAGGTPLTVNTTLGVATFNVNITGASGARTLNITGAGLTTATTTSVTIP